MHYCWLHSKLTLAVPMLPNFKIYGKLFRPTERHTVSSKKEKDFVQTKPYTHQKGLFREQHQYAAPATERSPVRLDSHSIKMERDNRCKIPSSHFKLLNNI